MECRYTRNLDWSVCTRSCKDYKIEIWKCFKCWRLSQNSGQNGWSKPNHKSKNKNSCFTWVSSKIRFFRITWIIWVIFSVWCKTKDSAIFGPLLGLALGSSQGNVPKSILNIKIYWTGENYRIYNSWTDRIVGWWRSWSCFRSNLSVLKIADAYHGLKILLIRTVNQFTAKTMRSSSWLWNFNVWFGSSVKVHFQIFIGNWFSWKW